MNELFGGETVNYRSFFPTAKFVPEKVHLSENGPISSAIGIDTSFATNKNGKCANLRQLNDKQYGIEWW